MVVPWPSMEVFEQLFPGLSQLGGSSNPSPASLRQLFQSAAAAISRVQSEWLLPGLTWLLSPLKGSAVVNEVTEDGTWLNPGFPLMGEVPTAGDKCLYAARS